MKEKVQPMVFTINETGERYELDFTRATVRAAEKSGFVLREIGDMPSIRLPELFFWAFRKNHKSVSREKTDKILEEEFEGLTGAYLERLVALYNQGLNSLIVSEDEEESRKNSKVTVEL